MRGDYQLVIGELHYGSQVWCHFLGLHPHLESVGVRLHAMEPPLPVGVERAGMVHARTQGKTFYLEPLGIRG